MTERPIYASVIKRNQSKVVPVALSSRATTTPEQPHNYMIIANAIFYNGIEPDKVYLGENLVWEKETTPPTPTYGSKTFAGKFIDDSMESDWEFWPNGKMGASSTKIKDYVDPETKEFNFEYDGTFTSCAYLLNGNLSIAKFQRIDHIPDTSGVKRMYMMFAKNTNLEEVDVSDLNTSKVTDMESMFNKCTALTSINLSGWNVENVTTINLMFGYCSSLSRFETTLMNFAKLTNANGLFYFCTALATVNLSGWNVENLKNMGDMFSNCTALTSINLSGWDLTKCTNLSSTFYNCSALTTVLGPINGISVNLDLHWSPLTAESAMVFINGLAEVETAKTITFKATTYNQLTAEQIAVATSKGWNVVRS